MVQFKMHLTKGHVVSRVVQRIRLLIKIQLPGRYVGNWVMANLGNLGYEISAINV
jgi:hypothetical protein